MKQLKSRLYFLIITTLSCLTIVISVVGVHSLSGGDKIVIGAKNCTEQHILAEILATLLESHTDLKVVRKFNLEGTSICFNALKSRSIDVYFEYTGTAILDIMKQPIPSGPLFEYVKTAFEKEYDINWLEPLGFSNQYVFITRTDMPIQKISDLEDHNKLKVAFDPEFAARDELTLLRQNYQGLDSPSFMDQVLLYFSLESKEMDVISAFSTDSRLLGDKFKILCDDKGVLPAYEVAPLITKKCLDKHPQAMIVFEYLKNSISHEQMSSLNYLVECQGKETKEVVQTFLKSAKMLP